MKTTDKTKIIAISSAAVLIILLDQLTKYFAVKITDSIPLIKNVFHLTLVQNTGSAFGLLKGSNYLIVWVSVIAVGIILYVYDKIPEEKFPQILAGLLLGGIVGNLIDRIRLGYVIDFLDFRIWPAFNIADAAITVSVIGLIIFLYKNRL